MPAPYLNRTERPSGVKDSRIHTETAFVNPIIINLNYEEKEKERIGLLRNLLAPQFLRIRHIIFF